MREQYLSHQAFTFRVKLVMMFFFVVAGVILARSFYLQILGNERLEQRAQAQYEQRQSLKLQRGIISDRNGQMLAVSLPMRSIYLVPHELENPLDTGKQLAEVLHLQEAKLNQVISKGKNFVWIKRNLPPIKAQEVMNLGLKGVYAIKEYQRFYPNLDLASHLTGFTGLDSKGLEGIEYQYNQHLMNSDVTAETWNPLALSPKVNALSGGSIELTLDLTLQHYVEQELGKAITAMKAKFGAVIVMESQTGEILSMAVKPDYDPNNFLAYNESMFFNRAVAHSFEPGSTFKIITMASALETGSITKDNYFFCENGKYQIGDRMIHDVAPHGFLDLEKIIQKSSNICAAKIAQLIPREEFYEMITKFGFGQKTNLGLSGEATGTLHDYKNWTEVTTATLSYGHGISATPIQIIAATNVFATGGVWVQPKLVRHLHLASGEEVEPEEEPVTRRVLQEEVANQVKKYMEAVVQPGGTGVRARLPEMAVAGKTGTSRKFDPKIGAYSNLLHITSFVGFFPVENPKITILVMIDEPMEGYLHSKSASVVFREIAEKIIPHYSFQGAYSFEAEAGEPAFAPSPANVTIRTKLEQALMGQNLRQALALASSQGLTLKATGQGKVAEVWRKGDETWVRLK